MSIERIQARLTEERGIDPASLSRVGMAAAVKRRMAALSVQTISRYADRISVDSAEFEQLVAAVLVHETSFFRYPASFELLAREGVARLQSDPRAVFRVCCVASSTGEEPASVVMALLEAGADPDRIHVDATDVSPRAVEYAERGRYRDRGVHRLPDARRRRWFEAEGSYYRLRRSIRRHVRTRVSNALDPEFGAGRVAYDAVFCRNLLIYLVPDARRKLLETLIGMVRRDGLLFVGHAEVSAARQMGLLMEAPPEAFACRKVAKLVPPAPQPSPPPRPRARPPRASSPARARSTPAPDVDALARASRYADAGDLPRAGGVLQAAIDAGRASADHFHLLALVESARGSDDLSEAALRRALYLDPKHYPSLMQMALLHDARGERGRARHLREQAARAKGDVDDA